MNNQHDRVADIATQEAITKPRCPSCGSRVHLDSDRRRNDTPRYHVYCQGGMWANGERIDDLPYVCGMRGPSSPSREGAMRVWRRLAIIDDGYEGVEAHLARIGEGE